MRPFPTPTATIVGTLALSLILAATAYRGAGVYHVPGRETIQFGLCDFHNAVYFPGKAYARGENPYLADYAQRYPVNREMSPYSPLLLPFAALFGVLPLRVAEFAWCVLNVGMMLWLAIWVRNAMGWQPRWASVLGIAAVLSASRAGHSNLILGQLGAIFAVATCYALADAHERPWRSGIALAIACLKPTFGMPLIVLMLGRGQRRAVGVGIALSLVGALLSLAWIQGSDQATIAHSVQSSHDAIIVDADVDPTSAWMRTDLMSLLSRWGHVTPSGVAEVGFMLVVLTPAAILFLAKSWRSRSVKIPIGPPQVPPPGQDRWLSQSQEPWPRLADALVVCLTLLSIYHLAYDCLVLTPAIGACLFRQDGPGAVPLGAPRIVHRAIGVLLAIPTTNYLATWSIMERCGLQGILRDVVIGLNPLCLGVAAVLLCGAYARWELIPQEPLGVTPQTHDV